MLRKKWGSRRREGERNGIVTRIPFVAVAANTEYQRVPACRATAYTYGVVRTLSFEKARSRNHGRSPKQPGGGHHIVSVPTVVRNIEQQQRGRENVALGVSLSDDSNDGPVNLHHHLLRTVFQFMGCTKVRLEYPMGILFEVDRATRPGQIFGKCIQPRQHLESACLLCSYCEGYNALLYGAAVKNHTKGKADLEGVP